jgi:26S proteasome regulatory subunit N1
MHFGEPMIRKAVPLAIGLLYASNPQLTVFETLSRYSHDSDLEVAVSAIFAMGLVGAGTNNARLAQLLRGLANYYHREANCLFMVRIAQGMLHMGKGTMTLNPYHTDRQVLSRISMAGLLPVLVSMLDAHQCTSSFHPPFFFSLVLLTVGVVLGNYHWLLYYLTPAMRARFLITLDAGLNPLPVTVRVGQAVDTVGQAGRPKTITGFQTHTTPVLISYGDRAELATEEYIPLASVLEGFVILKRNPEYMEEDK